MAKKIIAFSGMERCDLMYYTAKVLTKLGQNVLVVDNSFSKDMFESMDGFLGTNTIEKKNITYLQDIKFSEDAYEKFDYVLIYDGMAINEEEIRKCDLSYVISDYTPMMLRKIKGMFRDEDIVGQLILRDKVSSKIADQNVAELYEIKASNLAGCILYDEKDYNAYISLLYNGRQKIKGLSPHLEDAIVYIVAQVMDVDSREARKYMKRAKNEKL